MALRLKRPPEETPTSPEAWAQAPPPTPESRPHYYARHGLWRLRAVRRVAPWLLLLVPAAVIAVAAVNGGKVWHNPFHRQAKPERAQESRGALKPRGSSRASSPSQSAGGASAGATAGRGAPSSTSANAQLAAAAASPLLARIANLRSQLADLLRNGVTAAERPRLWRLRLRLALAFRDLIRAQIAVLRQGGVSAAEQARLASLLAQLRKLDARVALLRKIDRLFRGGVTASEHAKLDALIQQFAELKASTPLPPLSSVTAAIGVRVGASATASSAAGGTTTGGVAGAATTLTGTTASSGSAATDTSPGNSEFGHSHKKPKKPHGKR